jgi:hypothetical protein
MLYLGAFGVVDTGKMDEGGQRVPLIVCLYTTPSHVNALLLELTKKVGDHITINF